jgi:hypothetical protein
MPGDLGEFLGSRESADMMDCIMSFMDEQGLDHPAQALQLLVQKGLKACATPPARVLKPQFRAARRVD